MQAIGKRLIRLAMERRGAAYSWLSAHEADVAAVIKSQRRPPWKVISRVAIGKDGKPISPDMLRKAWKLLQQEKADAKPQSPFEKISGGLNEALAITRGKTSPPAPGAGKPPVLISTIKPQPVADRLDEVRALFKDSPGRKTPDIIE